MALGLSASEANTFLDTWGSTYSWIKLHTADPGASGATAAAANTTRKQITWASASGGLKSNSALVTWSDAEVTNTETYTHCSFWTASTAGTFGGSGTISGGSVAASGQAFNLNIGDIDLSLSVAA